MTASDERVRQYASGDSVGWRLERLGPLGWYVVAWWSGPAAWRASEAGAREHFARTRAPRLAQRIYLAEP